MLLRVLIISALHLASFGHASELVKNDLGLIIQIDGIDIDFSTVGVLKYDYVPTDVEFADIRRCLAEMSQGRQGRPLAFGSAKRLGNYILIIAQQPGTVDGGLDVVYSASERKIVGLYNAGYRG